MDPYSDHMKGLMITGLGGLLLTMDIPLIRLGDGEAWSVILLRSTVTIAAALGIRTLLKAMGADVPPIWQGRAGLIVTLLYSITSIAFMLAVYLTPTANLVFILALNPMVAALFGRIFLGERLRRETLIAMIIMVFGVWLIVSDGMATGSMLGNILALVASISVAAGITVSRASGRDMGFSAVMSAVVMTVIAAGIVGAKGYTIAAPSWIVIDGVLMTVALYCLAAGPKWLSGPEVAMFYLLETVLAPIWVWLIFAEVPTRMTAIGGSLVIAALIGHTAIQIMRDRKRRLASRPL